MSRFFLRNVHFFVVVVAAAKIQKVYDIVVNTACIRYIIYGFQICFCVHAFAKIKKNIATTTTACRNEHKLYQNNFTRKICVQNRMYESIVTDRNTAFSGTKKNTKRILCGIVLLVLLWCWRDSLRSFLRFSDYFIQCVYTIIVVVQNCLFHKKVKMNLSVWVYWSCMWFYRCYHGWVWHIHNMFVYEYCGILYNTCGELRAPRFLIFFSSPTAKQ